MWILDLVVNNINLEFSL